MHVSGFCHYSWQNTSRDTTCEQLHLISNDLSFVFQVRQKALAASDNIAICNLEISCVPRIRDVPMFVRIVQQKAYFVFRIFSKNPKHVPSVSLFHANQIIIFIIIRFLQLHCSFSVTGNSMLRQFTLCRRIHRITDSIPDFLCTRRRRGDVELVTQPTGADHVLKDKFCHWRTTYFPYQTVQFHSLLYPLCLILLNHTHP